MTDREQIARIIDTIGWEMHDAMTDEDFRFSGFDIETSLIKADAILALASPLILGGGEEGSSDLSKPTRLSGSHITDALCEDCPPEDYPTDKTRCAPCPRRPSDAPAPPWPATPENGNNARRHGWLRYFAGYDDVSTFPPARADLNKAFHEGYAAAKSARKSTYSPPPPEGAK